MKNTKTGTRTAQKRHPRSRTVVPTLRRHSVTKRQPASAKAYTACRSLQSPRAALEFLGLSYSEFGIEYSRLVGGHAFSRQSVYKMLNARLLTDNALQVLGQLLSNHLTRICGETIGVSIMQNSPMHVSAYRRCNDCGDLYEIDRPNTQRCSRCRK